MRRKKKRKSHFKKKFIKYIERRTVRRLLFLSRNEVSDQLWNILPLKKTDKFLEESNNLNDSFLNRCISINEIHLSEAYMNTAIILLAMIQMTNSNGIRDGLIYPALFSFRHYLELTMKDSLNHFNESGELDASVTRREHSLVNLWNDLAIYIEEGESKDIMIKLMNEVNMIDPVSERFRYPYEISSKRGKILPPIKQ
ncbi:MAG: hypothetical protein IKH99_00225 [Prevotella sp.]|nr:hypothetical protein [Prevotella sp.]